MSRQDIEFFSSGVRCAAWLYLPEAERRPPVIVMAHGLGGVREMRLEAFADRFCKAGFACLVFDYRHFGASDGEPRQLLSVRKELDDWRAAVACARGLPEVDGGRLALWGTSFSGGHVLTIAAEDHGIRAVVSQCPFTNGLASMTAVRPLTLLRLTALAVRDQVGALLGREPLLVRAAGKPGALALMSSPDCESGYLRLVPAHSTFRNEVAARFALDITRYFPGFRTPRITAPVLFCVCGKDSVAPAGMTRWHARRAPLGETRNYDTGHFEIYTGPGFEQVVEDQIVFLKKHLLAG